MNSRGENKHPGISENGDVDLYWEDLDRHWHLPRVDGKDEPNGFSATPSTLRRRQMRRAQRTGAAIVSVQMMR